MTSLALNFIYPFPINTKNKRLAGVNQKLSSGSYLPLNMSSIGRNIPSRRPNKPKEICGNTISTSTTETTTNCNTTRCNNTTITNTCTGKSTTTINRCISDEVYCPTYPTIPSNKSWMS